MLNILPFDGTGRLRGGKRFGTLKLWNAALGSETDSVLLLDQVTLISTGSAEATIFFDSFEYASGELNSVSSGVWDIYDAGTGLTSTDVIAAGNAVTITGSHAGSQYLLIPDVAPTVDLTAGYSVEMTAETSLENAQAIGIAIETDATDYFISGPVFSVDLSTDGTFWTLTFSPRGSTFTPGTDYFTGDVTATMTNPCTLKVSVSAGTGTSRTAQVFLNDVQVGGFDCPLPASDSHVNFIWSMTESTTIVPPTIDDVTIKQAGTDTDGIPARTTKIIAVANRDVYFGTLTVQGVLATNGTDVVTRHVFPSGCFSAGKYFMVDGVNIIQVDIDTETVETYGTGGSIVGTPPMGTVCCIWRDRLVIGGPDQNFYLSRVGNHFDWDYSQEDEAAAFAGNGSTAGHIGEPIVALIPLGDDVLAIGGDHDLHAMRGDPKAGGSIDLISEAVGILGPRSWCKSPEGTVYFLGTGGLYKWDVEGKPVNIADEKWSQIFASIDRSRTFATMAWDRDKQGMYIFLYRTGKTIVDPPTHLWYDRRADALFPIQYPVGHGPTSILVYDGDGPDDRVLLLGCRDGYVRQMSPATNPALSDDGDPIVAKMKFGPFPLGDPNNDGIISRVQVTFGEPPTGLTTEDLAATITVRAGLTAYDVTDRGDDSKVRKAVREYDGQQGRVIPMRQRVKGAYGMIEITDDSDDRTFSFEQMTVDMVLAGFTRH